ncbi:helix-turn-helix domain-containing protein [Flavobacterium soyangense]|uniref:Helix-turn-helix transcriptional regulator n=1 Tax=Flavobacterium soyangense TaxID=2023265 RepID=A0A930U702_9FLAO|nr:helix-turn-helix domain-containing protein [Flavobacterium soyangense]MBF2708068.1 helix-turn-helix transcriptional regulator [Flavobacterium soyangense]
MIYSKETGEFLRVIELTEENQDLLFNNIEGCLTVLWNTGDEMTIKVDGVLHHLVKNEFIFLTQVHKIDSLSIVSARLIRFNRSFFCVVGYDDAVSCKGILFFGSSTIPKFIVVDENFEKFDMLWKMLRLDMATNDNLQIDMLQTMLIRILVECTRCFKKFTNFEKIEKYQSDVVREFYYLVESHFIEHHDVAFYASKLNKSPKTLSNLFSIISNKTPLQVIHERLILHAKRQIQYSERSVKEIAYDLGFDEIQTFSRFFKNKEGVSPSEYRGLIKFMT